MHEVHFGTDGWRARIGHGFTFRNVRQLARAYAVYLKKKGRKGEIGVVVGHDTRYLADRFAAEAARVLSQQHVHVHLPSRDGPAPALALAVIENRLAGSLAVVATPDDPTVSGIKLFDSSGAPALPSLTCLVEHELARLPRGEAERPEYPEDFYYHALSLRAPYLRKLESLVDFAAIRKAKLRLVVDSLHGTTREYLDKVLADRGCQVLAIRNYLGPFGGDPLPACRPSDLGELATMVTARQAHLGLALSSHGDRFLAFDENGRFVEPARLMPMLVDYLLGERRLEGGVVRSVAATSMLDAAGAAYGRDTHEVPVGSKFIVDGMASQKAAVGVDEVGGAVLSGSGTGRDGMLFALLTAEMTARRGLPLSEQLRRFARRYPKVCRREAALPALPARQKAFQRLLETGSAGSSEPTPVRVTRLDGLKFTFAQGWLLLRASGTDPLIRLTAEGNDVATATHLIRLGRKLLG